MIKIPNVDPLLSGMEKENITHKHQVVNNLMLLRIQLSENEPEEACDEKTLQDWVHSGKIQAHHLIWSPEQQSWIEAKKWPSLEAYFASSLWDAWNSNDDWELNSDIETGLRRRIKEQTPTASPMPPPEEERQQKRTKLPLSAIQPIDDPPEIEHKRTSASIEEELLQSVQAQKRHSVPPIPSITKETREKEPVSLASSWNPDASLRDQPQFWMAEEPNKKPFSSIRVGLIVIIGLVPLLGYREWFISEATSEFPLEEEIDALQRGEPTATEKDNSRKEEGLITLEQDLKSALRTDIQEVNQKHSFSDALLIEMTYVDLNIQNIVADVLSWKGRRLDTPKATVVSVTLNSTGEVDRELALVSMIIAKYTEHYTLNMEKFSVTLILDGTKIEREVSVSEARNLLLRPGALPTFLSKIVD